MLAGDKLQPVLRDTHFARRTMNITAVQWRQIVDSALDTAIISTDRDGRVTSWSTGATRILGYEEHEMLGRRLDGLFTEEDRKKGVLEREIADALSIGRGGGEEGWRVRKDGELFWAIGELAPYVTTMR